MRETSAAANGVQIIVASSGLSCAACEVYRQLGGGLVIYADTSD